MTTPVLGDAPDLDMPDLDSSEMDADAEHESPAGPDWPAEVSLAVRVELHGPRDPKEEYLWAARNPEADHGFREPSDPVRAWLAGTAPIGEELARELEAETGVPAATWTAQDTAYVAAGGVRRGALLVYTVDASEQWEPSQDVTQTLSLERAQAVARAHEVYDAWNAGGSSTRFTSVRRSLVWLS